ncbi:uncharacterized protein TNCV_4688471 [Trichonephila clavipes]|nr:uncharacterized protein TNCV_4688471 [Trichonephila clavipes]
MIGMMEAGCSARREARQLGRSDCAVRRCWDQWIREVVIYMKTRFRMPSIDQSSRRPPYHKECTRTDNCLSSAIQAQVAPSLGAPVPF